MRLAAFSGGQMVVKEIMKIRQVCLSLPNSAVGGFVSGFGLEDLVASIRDR